LTQVDVELAEHRRQLEQQANPRERSKTQVQWEALRKSLLQERLRVISSDGAQAM
jgi:hypothetical protein